MYVCGCVQYIRLVWRPSCPNTALHLPRALFFFLFLSTLQQHHHHHKITTQISYSTLSAPASSPQGTLLLLIPVHTSPSSSSTQNITAQIINFKNVTICGLGPCFSSCHSCQSFSIVSIICNSFRIAISNYCQWFASPYS